MDGSTTREHIPAHRDNHLSCLSTIDPETAKSWGRTPDWFIPGESRNGNLEFSAS